MWAKRSDNATRAALEHRRCTKISISRSITHHDDSFADGSRWKPRLQVAMGKLTTHVLDVSSGIPAAGVRIEVHSLSSLELLSEQITGPDGRCASSLLEGVRFKAERYALTFHIGEYFRTRGVVLPQPAFIEEAIIRIGIASPEQHYHVPLLISPWSYSVYRGG